VFEKRALRKIFVSERDDAIGYWRRLHNDELHDLYSPNVIRLIKPRRMRWAGHVVHVGERIGVFFFWGVGNLNERDHLEDLQVNGRMILQWM